MILIDNLVMDNPVARMNGPTFLFVYFVFILVVYLVGYILKKIAEKRFSESSINVVNTPDPDPYMIAFLRAGVSDTTKLVVYNLFERGYLRTSPKKTKVGQNPGHPPIENLSELEKVIFEHIGDEKTIEDVVDYPGMLISANTIYEGKILQSDFKDLYFGETKKESYNNIRWGMITFLFGFGFYKLFIALSTDHYNVLFLILMMIVSISLIQWVMTPPRLTIAGEKYLQDLKQIYAQKYFNGIKTATYNYKLLLLGVLGVGLLRELGYDFLVNYTKEKNIVYSGSGSCGSSSCSSGSSCGGGSCGGGCGGCGGGD